MNEHLRKLSLQACQKINLTYPGDALPGALASMMLRDLHDELNKIKWAGDDEGWDRAIEAVRKELRSRYGVNVA
jgi:hypothetical protein